MTLHTPGHDMTAETVPIADIFIDAQRKLCVRPEQPHDFAFIYRAGMEVQWCDATRCLYSPAPREWSYLRWYEQIVSAVLGEYGVQLVTTARTTFHDVPDEVAKHAVRDQV